MAEGQPLVLGQLPVAAVIAIMSPVVSEEEGRPARPTLVPMSAPLPLQTPVPPVLKARAGRSHTMKSSRSIWWSRNSFSVSL